jgi:hypothetical protein
MGGLVSDPAAHPVGRRPQHSWSNIERPVLIGTGDGDSTCDRLAEPGSCFGQSPYIRRIISERMYGGNKFHIYLKDADTFHTLFELHTAECSDPSKNVDQAKCDEIARWLTSTALAFSTRMCAAMRSRLNGWRATTSPSPARASRSGSGDRSVTPN